MRVSECWKALCKSQFLFLITVDCDVAKQMQCRSIGKRPILGCTCPLCYCVKPLAFSAACLFLPSQNGKNLPKYLLTSVLWNVFF